MNMAWQPDQGIIKTGRPAISQSLAAVLPMTVLATQI